MDGELELTPKKIYEEVWACRNFELSNLWQRSVFLGTFMLAIVAGYGGCVFGNVRMIPDMMRDFI